jgi:cystathionine beta-synthase
MTSLSKPKPSQTTAVNSILDLIGHTPLVRVHAFDTGTCELYLKLESQNPGGSIKDRIALSMIEAAEREGKIKPGALLVEATAGNTGLGLALVAAQKGYRLLLVIPDKMSLEKIQHIKAMGAEVVMTRSDVVRGHPEYYQDMARRIADETPGAFYINQFENPANPFAHEHETAPEILAQMGGDVDAIVCGVGSGGTLSGIGHYMRKHSPKTEMVLADPDGSILAPLINEGKMITPGSWLVEGIGEDFIPDICDLSLVKHAYTITDAESIATARELLAREGILCGSSSGTLIAAALRYCRAQTTPKRVVTFVCDSGNKYLSKIYNPFWLRDQGIAESAPTGDLRDLIARPYLHGEVIWAHASDTLAQVYAKMKRFDVSQVPVMEGERIIGMIEETDLLLAATTPGGNGFSTPADQIMRQSLATVDPDCAVENLTPIFEQGRVAAVVDAGRFLGLITPLDLLNHLRRHAES